MHAEKFELLEAKIRETALLVSRLRGETPTRQENEQLRERLYELEEESASVTRRFLPVCAQSGQPVTTARNPAHRWHEGAGIRSGIHCLAGAAGKRAEER